MSNWVSRRASLVVKTFLSKESWWDNCKAVADEYIECEPIIILIDLILHKKKAYTHFLYNVIDSQAPAFQMLMDVVFGNFLFFSTFVLATRALFSKFPRSLGYKDLLLAILISSYFKMFLIAMMVWECPFVILIIDLFVLSSNTVALKGQTIKYLLSWTSFYSSSISISTSQFMPVSAKCIYPSSLVLCNVMFMM
ncbi:hypothetical protein ABKV19_023641 [Rosa sericea]